MGFTIYRAIYFVIGALLATSFILLAVISIPVYIFRLFVMLLTKWFRSDLGSILDPISACLANDYFTSTPPRANLIVSLTYQGHLTLEEVKQRILDHWIHKRELHNNRVTFPQFQQYPVRWMGFTFWKNVQYFCIQNHFEIVNDVTNEEELDLKIESVLNTLVPRGQSPWKFHFIEHFQHETASTENHFVIICHYHHCLADGMAIQLALLTAFNDNFSVENYQLPNIQHKRQGNIIWQTIIYPFRVFYQLSKFFSYAPQQSLLKVPDHKKKWHQLYVKSKAISIQSIKDTKNRLDVSFTSVIVCSISKTVAKYLQDKGSNKASIPFMSVFPIPGVNRIKNKLTNFATAALYEIPLNTDMGTLERLRCCDELLQNVRSTVPMLSYYISLVRGCHFYWVNRLLENTMLPIGMTNIAVPADTIRIKDATCVQILGIVGCMPGVAGMGFVINSFGDAIRIQIAVEQAVLTREEAKHVIHQIENEIEQLEVLSSLESL